MISITEMYYVTIDCISHSYFIPMTLILQLEAWILIPHILFIHKMLSFRISSLPSSFTKMESRKDTIWERHCVQWPHGRGTAEPSGLRLVLGPGRASVSSHLVPTSSAGFCCPGLPWIGPILCCLPQHSPSHCGLPTPERTPFPLLGPAT